MMKVPGFISWSKVKTSLDTKKQERLISQGKEFKVPYMVSSRIYERDPGTGTFAEGSISISDVQYPKNNQEIDKDTRVAQVQSSAIDSVRYSPKDNHLWLRYRKPKGGATKEYVFDVTPDEFRAFMNAGSKGRYAHYVLKRNNQAPSSWY